MERRRKKDAFSLKRSESREMNSASKKNKEEVALMVNMENNERKLSLRKNVEQGDEIRAR